MKGVLLLLSPLTDRKQTRLGGALKSLSLNTQPSATTMDLAALACSLLGPRSLEQSGAI